VKNYIVKPLPKDLTGIGQISSGADKSYKKIIDVISQFSVDASRLSKKNWAKYSDMQGTYAHVNHDLR